jgi:hypothetical protein
MRHAEYISEGYALSDWLEAFEYPTEHDYPFRQDSIDEVVNAMRFAFVNAKNANVGAKIVCPGCGKSFVKKTYHNKFCTSKGRANCKDRYWNSVDDVRRNRASQFSKR